MLCQFSFKNFKSYKEATTFDFQATSVPEFSDALLTSEKGNAGRGKKEWRSDGREGIEYLRERSKNVIQM